MRIEGFTPARLVTPGELPGGAPTATRDVAPAGPRPPAERASGAAGDGFSQTLGQELGRVNEALSSADEQARRVASGEADNLHDALIAAAEADLALQVTMRVTQKAIAAYQEISRMQV